MARKIRRSNDIYNIVSYNVKKYRKEKKITQQQLAELSDYSFEFIRRIESPNCKKSFSIEAINIISNVLDIPIYKFFIK